MTDGWPLYESRLKGELHVISKRYTQRIERHNQNLRQHLARLGGKSLSFSKSVALHDKVIGHYLNIKHYKLVITNQFTTYSLRDCGSLRNPRTIRLYESLAQFKSSGLWVTTHAWLNDRFVLPESQQKNLAELKRSFLDPALKQINEKTPLLAKYSIDDSGKFLFSIIDKQNPV